jgi:hypothetical protein
MFLACCVRSAFAATISMKSSADFSSCDVDAHYPDIHPNLLVMSAGDGRENEYA